MLTDSKEKLDSIWQPGFQPAVQYVIQIHLFHAQVPGLL